MTAAELSLGPVLFNWAPEVWRDFYFAIADEVAVDWVHLGEVVCSKRAPLLDKVWEPVVERLGAAGKRIVFDTPHLVVSPAERQALRALSARQDRMIEANDGGALALLGGRPHMIGPMVNCYNEGAMAWFAERGAVAICLPGELDSAAIATMAQAGRGLGVAVEVHAFGRVPLAISSRCNHARAHGLHKDGCQFVCGRDGDGLAVQTLDRQDFLAINGTQTLSHAVVCLLAELRDLVAAGVSRFRLSPQTIDMKAVVTLYRDVLDGRRDGVAARADLGRLVAGLPLANGFIHGREGLALVTA
ncbi:MAG: U32 family peptidase [Azospirillaceae bacterium]|nr:U32 family peptidase [Azospirillaceae bacterium]